ncbi:hypothetical protein P154DRAFT_572987 [Amniculicola lignicola CBS 123094]|uniref:Uncharacterized protein n=1 Tax=Amniculicola lignicola CBS 123094 TaxID=1392246 RepID=A0A6A5WPC6_9PLEO|nr:hypothetical protein P154DRAFT_572987 [Amniculicola lignicola CBS 123094]
MAATWPQHGIPHQLEVLATTAPERVPPSSTCRLEIRPPKDTYLSTLFTSAKIDAHERFPETDVAGTSAQTLPSPAVRSITSNFVVFIKAAKRLQEQRFQASYSPAAWFQQTQALSFLFRGVKLGGHFTLFRPKVVRPGVCWLELSPKCQSVMHVGSCSVGRPTCLTTVGHGKEKGLSMWSKNTFNQRSGYAQAFATCTSHYDPMGSIGIIWRHEAIHASKGRKRQTSVKRRHGSLPPRSSQDTTTHRDSFFDFDTDIQF